MEKKVFKTEVADLLHLIIHSLYSHKEIFMRELISNASDALDKRKIRILTGDSSSADELCIDISFTEDEPKKIIISDNGIGMTHDELVQNIGTIAHSGTKEFLSSLTEEQKSGNAMIGQFGVGFYSAFLVADEVEVISKSIVDDKAYKWRSKGVKDYTIEEVEKDKPGTDIVLYLNSDGFEFAHRWAIENIIKKYSDHIAYPIYLSYDQNTYNEKHEVTGKEHKREKINSSSAIWIKNKNSLKPEDYNDFYRNVFYDNEDPLFYLHSKTEGSFDFTTLFYVPKHAPSDIMNVDYKFNMKLYVKRVFIFDNNKDLFPMYLRFVRGIIDSDDLPLNVSREILQENLTLRAIKGLSVKKLLAEFKRVSEQEPDKYTEFIKEYNSILKEGILQDNENYKEIIELVRFKSSNLDGYTSLADYKKRMIPEQKSIYYICGISSLKNSSLVQSYVKKGYEVLIFDDNVDEFVATRLTEYDGMPLKAINRSGALDDFLSEDEKKNKSDSSELKKIKDSLGDSVKDVIKSSRLDDIASQIVIEDMDMSYKMGILYSSLGKTDFDLKPILEINEKDPLVKSILESDDEEYVKFGSSILLNDAFIREGIMPKNNIDYSSNLHSFILKNLNNKTKG